MKVVSNSSPLISLARIGMLNLLKDYFGEIFIPPGVYDEVCFKGKGKPGAEEVESADWIKLREIENRFAAQILEIELDRGEAEVIVLAKEINADIVLVDDRRPREVLKRLGFKVLGTVGVLIKAARDGRINLKETLDELTSKGFRLSKEVYEEALRQATRRAGEV